MANRQNIPYRTTVTVDLIAPTNTTATPHDPLDNTDDGSTCTFKVYDPAKDETISNDEAIGQTVLSVTDAGNFVAADVVEVEQNDGTLLESTVASVDSTNATITLDDALTVAADAGSRVRVRLGDEITMSEFGTPVLEEIDWGFRGALASNHPGLDLQLEVDIEISFVGAVDGSLDRLDTICGVIKPSEECD